MSHVTEAELVEIVPDLRALARVRESAEVRTALNRLAAYTPRWRLDTRILRGSLWFVSLERRVRQPTTKPSAGPTGLLSDVTKASRNGNIIQARG
jgi:hypothetical protein